MNQENTGTWTLEKLRRKRDQAWDLAGCARRDGDKKDEQRWTNEALRYSKLIYERMLAGEK